MAEKKKALVADDQAINRSFVKVYLNTRGYEVETAEDGMKALAACRTKVYDLVFSDVEMPNMNGIEFLRSAKRLPGYDKVPFVILSTLDTDDMKAKAASFGAFHYMVKPFNDTKMMELFQKLQKLS
jgi:two-component system chemotaxis response regulator CheY